MSVRLTNTQRTQQTFNLTREFAPVRHVFPRAAESASGQGAARSVRLVLPDSVTFLAGESRVYPDGVMTCPEIRGAVESKRLKIEQISETKAAGEAAPKMADEDKPAYAQRKKS